VLLDASDLVTIGPEHEAWNGEALVLGGDVGFVRLRPPPGVSEALVERLKAFCTAKGAAVKVEPHSRAEVVPLDPPTFEDGVRMLRRSIREHVEALVEEANTEDKEALKASVEASLSRAGL